MLPNPQRCKLNGSDVLGALLLACLATTIASAIVGATTWFIASFATFLYALYRCPALCTHAVSVLLAVALRTGVVMDPAQHFSSASMIVTDAVVKEVAAFSDARRCWPLNAADDGEDMVQHLDTVFPRAAAELPSLVAALACCPQVLSCVILRVPPCHKLAVPHLCYRGSLQYVVCVKGPQHDIPPLSACIRVANTDSHCRLQQGTRVLLDATCPCFIYNFDVDPVVLLCMHIVRQYGIHPCCRPLNQGIAVLAACLTGKRCERAGPQAI